MVIMRQSQLFTKTRREAPTDEVSKNAQLLIRGGYIYKEMAGVYALLPLGLQVFNNIVQIIREEMNAIGGQEVVLTALQQKETWEPTNQWSDKEVDIWFKTSLKNGTELGLAVTHEAAITKMMKDFVSSYRDLPSYPYQFQTKFRNETRAKSGIMRTREFVMKDMYSFSGNQQEHDAFYEKSKVAYANIFRRAGIGDTTYLTFASGGMFSKFSHEFQTISDAGEDIIYIHKEKNIAINKEVYTDEIKKELGLSGDFIEAKSVEVGNIFTLSTRFSEALLLTYKTEEGKDVPVFMGSYGIGPARLMGTIQREAALALGATRWEAIAGAVIPYARSGILGGVILGLGRALGETMAVTMVIGNRHDFATSLFAPGYTMASLIANEFSEASGDLHLSALMAVGLILFVITLIVNAIARWLVWRVTKGPGGAAA